MILKLCLRGGLLRFASRLALSGRCNRSGNAFLFEEFKMTVAEIVLANKKKLHDLSFSFRMLFKLNLCNYLGSAEQLLTGFEITKFNDDIKCPDNVSLKKFVLKKYGKEAVSTILELINGKAV